METEVVYVEKPKPSPEFLERCVETLPTLSVGPEESYPAYLGWDVVLNEWAPLYFKCADKHNALVEYLNGIVWPEE